jgi:4-diphosphocytidyl-2-C-methyl-D-erythritol kinase
MSVFEAPAKVNLSLLVGSAAPNGYHPIVSLVQTVDLCDSLQVDESDEDAFIATGAELDEEDNLVVAALRSVRERAFVPPVEMRLDKRIPFGAGLGGGSSDAAAMLLAATGLASQPRSLAEELAPGLGSDVPLFLIGGSTTISGFGEIIETHRPLEGFAIAIAVPGFELATADVYRRWDRLEGPIGREVPARSLPGPLRDGMPIRNDLAPAAIDLEPELGDFLSDLNDRWGVPALMTGSGSGCFGLFGDLGEAVDAARAVPGEIRLAVGVELRREGVTVLEG